MALPAKGPIDANVVQYLQDLVSNKPNPEQLRTIVFLFDGQEPRVFHRPGSGAIELGSVAVKEVAKSVNRFDQISSVIFEQNPTCQWLIVNGMHRKFCG
jgi:hypothetical protein